MKEAGPDAGEPACLRPRPKTFTRAHCPDGTLHVGSPGIPERALRRTLSSGASRRCHIYARRCVMNVVVVLEHRHGRSDAARPEE
jgi:hypothetical protein